MDTDIEYSGRKLKTTSLAMTFCFAAYLPVPAAIVVTTLFMEADVMTTSAQTPKDWFSWRSRRLILFVSSVGE